MDASTRIEIVAAYGTHLEGRTSMFNREVDLPYPKELIRQALAEELLVATTTGAIDALEAGFLHLEDFVSDREYEAVRSYQEFMARVAAGEVPAAVALEQSSAAVESTSFAIDLMKRTASLHEARSQQLARIRELRKGAK